MLSSLLGGVEYSALQKAYRNDDRIAFIHTYHQMRMLDSVFGIGVGVNPKYAENLAPILNDIDAKIREFSKNPPSQDDIDATVTAYRNGVLIGLETVESRVSLLRGDYMETGNPNALFARLAQLDKVAPADIQRVCQKYLYNNIVM